MFLEAENIGTWRCFQDVRAIDNRNPTSMDKYFNACAVAADHRSADQPMWWGQRDDCYLTHNVLPYLLEQPLPRSVVPQTDDQSLTVVRRYDWRAMQDFYDQLQMGAPSQPGMHLQAAVCSPATHHSVYVPRWGLVCTTGEPRWR